MPLLNATGQNTLETNQQPPKQLHAPISTPIDKSPACFPTWCWEAEKGYHGLSEAFKHAYRQKLFFSFLEQCGTVLV